MIEISRRRFVKQTAAHLLRRTGGLIGRLPGSPLLSAGIIARRAGRRAVVREIDGLAYRGDAPPSSPIGFDDPFRVASISKMLTATAFMRFAAARGVSLDGDVSDLLGDRLRHPAFVDTPITARMLLSHTSGLRNGDDFPVPFGRRLLDRLRDAASEPNFGGWFAPPQEPPGIWFSYSDVNFGVLGQIMERIGGERFDRIMHTLVFEPLGLEIGYNWSGVSQAKRNRAAAGARWLDGAWSAEVDAHPPSAPAIALYRGDSGSTLTEEEYHPGDNGLACAPHGGLRLSLADMDRLARLYARQDPSLIEPDLLSEMTRVAWMYAPQSPNGNTWNGFYQAFGLGVHTPLGRDGDAFFGADSPQWRGHFGDAYGWITGLFWNVRSGDTIVYALNGMPEADRPRGRRSALTAPEETLIDLALSAL